LRTGLFAVVKSYAAKHAASLSCVPLVGLCAVLKNSVQLENRASPVFEKFKKKINEIQKILVKMYRKRQRNSENREN
jgi:hypothetical protein